VRRRILLLTLAALVAAGAAVGGVLLARDGSPGGVYVGSRPPTGITLPDFALPEAGGAVVRGRDLRGKVVLVTFLDTECREACPLIAERIRAGLGFLSPEERTRVAAVAITVNPEHDTPASVAAFLRDHRAQGTLHYLIGSEQELRPVWTAFAVQPSLDTGEADIHSAPVQIYDTSAVWASTLTTGVDLTPENLAHEVRVALG